ncbi:MAG: hypothetical protein CMH53_10675 [Myxococcales bacterium]|nr:hypothetical protein [Myxococcales bacterium]
MKPDDIGEGLRRFATPPHRCEPAGSIGSVRFINDSKATNPHAALAGVKGTELHGEECLVWIGGGSDKQSDFSALTQEIARRAHTAVVCGATAPQLISALNAAQGACQVVQASDLHSAIALAWQHAQPHGCVLFSPACASFDFFQSYAHRGEVFKQAVERLRAAVTPSKENLTAAAD